MHQFGFTVSCTFSCTWMSNFKKLTLNAKVHINLFEAQLYLGGPHKFCFDSRAGWRLILNPTEHLLRCFQTVWSESEAVKWLLELKFLSWVAPHRQCIWFLRLKCHRRVTLIQFPSSTWADMNVRMSLSAGLKVQLPSGRLSVQSSPAAYSMLVMWCSGLVVDVQLELTEHWASSLFKHYE